MGCQPFAQPPVWGTSLSHLSVLYTSICLTWVSLSVAKLLSAYLCGSQMCTGSPQLQGPSGDNSYIHITYLDISHIHIT
uniref:Uncharacterized protein n=2 Tax=Arion vulgaris TaxID=1028688 RepID=A0A0B7B0T3_9EUPU